MKQDNRINAKSMSLKSKFFIFGIIFCCCASYLAVCASYMTSNREIEIYFYLSMITYIVVLSILVSAIFIFLRKKYFIKPLLYIAEGARKIASGDYSVRLQPLRKDGKKDEIEVLIEDFNLMAEELSSVEMLKSDFVASVSHELKTPLAQISNYVSILQSNILEEAEREEYLEQIGNSTRKLSVLITNILQLNRLDNQKIHTNKKKYNLSEQIFRCILNYDQLLDEKEIGMLYDIADEVYIVGDENLMDLVWNNILSNAIKFVPMRGHIEIKVIQSDGGVSVEITDDGCGICEQDLLHIFEKFYQSDSSRATDGNGLGLALVKEIVELMKYSIKVKSKVGVGTTFIITIPAE